MNYEWESWVQASSCARTVSKVVAELSFRNEWSVKWENSSSSPSVVSNQLLAIASCSQTLLLLFWLPISERNHRRRPMIPNAVVFKLLCSVLFAYISFDRFFRLFLLFLLKAALPTLFLLMWIFPSLFLFNLFKRFVRFWWNHFRYVKKNEISLFGKWREKIKQ